MPFVLDASVALTWFFPDEESDYANRVLKLTDQDTAVVPPIWILEVANALLIGERRGRLGPADLARCVQLLHELSPRTDAFRDAEVLEHVAQAARSHGLTAYDAAYVYLAQREGLRLATLDARLRSAAERAGVALIV